MNNALAGAIAGATGTAALNFTNYCDMALTGRSPSDTPAEVIRRIAKRTNLEPLNQADAIADNATKNRRTGLGAASGYLMGMSIGTVYGLVSPLFSGVPTLTKGLVLGAVSMLAGEAPATALSATDPRRWGIKGWVSDLVPRAVYGLVTVMTVDAIRANRIAEESALGDANEITVAEVIDEEIIV